MKALLVVVLLLSVFVPAHAAVTLAVSQQSGPAAREQASLLAGKIGSVLKAPVKVVELPDHGQVEAWLNRFATADLALFETSHVAGKPGQFVTIGPAGEGLTLVGRQGIAGDLPRNIAAILGGGIYVRKGSASGGLSGLLPICAHCKKIRDDKGYWNRIENYIRDRSEAEFTHGICPECAERHFPEPKPGES